MLACTPVAARLAADGEFGPDDEAAWERRAHRWNQTEQEAYAVEKAFLVQAGWGDKGLTPADAGMLDGVDTWLADAKG